MKNNLYENIMNSISKSVKKAINEAYWFDNPGDLRLSDGDIKALALMIYDEVKNGSEASSIEFDPEEDEYCSCTFEWHMEKGKIICDYSAAGWCDRDGDEDECDVAFDINKLQAEYDSLVEETLPF